MLQVVELYIYPTNIINAKVCEDGWMDASIDEWMFVNLTPIDIKGRLSVFLFWLYSETAQPILKGL